MNIQELKGVGLRLERLLNKIDIKTVEDLVEYYPFRFEFFSVQDINLVTDENENVLIKGTVYSEAKLSFFKRMNRMSFQFKTGGKLINAVIFNRSFLKGSLTLGKEIMLYGKYNERGNSFLITQIKPISEVLNFIEPIYHLTKGLTNKELQKLIKLALNLKLNIDDYVPQFLNNRYKFLPKQQAIKSIHFPVNAKEIQQAKLKLIYEELFIFMFKIMFLKEKESKIDGTKKDASIALIKEFINSLPYSLTKDQLNASLEILKDLNSAKKMNRILLGDVGSGKTIVAIIGIYANFLSGYQTAFMAPTEILAKQHYEKLKELFAKFNIRIALILGLTPLKEKNKIYQEAKEGLVDVIIGTHSLLSEKLKFLNLGLVITDEQHRFGVEQRKNLSLKGENPDCLYLSATPIPRTFALTIYGEMETSFIKEKPKNRKEVKTFIKQNKDIKEILFKMLEELNSGNQIYVVAPLIEENEDDIQTVLNLEKKMKMAFKDKASIDILHGKLKDEEKRNVMQEFQKGRINILIATTMIEVGVDNPKATMMVIFNADYFGLATLHQLRGRVGRGELASFCYLISDKETERLKILEESNDGFYISEKDFELRGGGDLFGTLQSGEKDFKLANLKRDYKILRQAHKDVLEFIKSKEYVNDEKFKSIIKSIEVVS